MRKIIAVGDLHGDFYRLVRILSEQNILDPVTHEWKPEAKACDVILLGDYVDWRGEPLEGPPEEWPQGTRKLVELLYRLSKTAAGNFYPLLGNHDAMMLDSYETLEKLCAQEPGILQNHDRLESLLVYLSQEHDLSEVTNWTTQGGEKTVESFGGVQNWFAAMGSDLGDFLRALPLAVSINEKLFCHSVPDSKEYWIPIHTGQKIPEEKLKAVREQFLWGRKMWGFDAFAGGVTKPMTEPEVDEMLQSLGVKAVVIGHTSLRQGGPYFHFGGKVINLDLHGMPGSPAYIEEYEVKEPKQRKRAKFQKKWKAGKRFGRH